MPTASMLKMDHPVLGCESLYPPGAFLPGASKTGPLLERAFRLANALGFELTLVARKWSDFEKSDGTFDWKTKEHTNLQRSLHESGLHTFYRINSPVAQQRRWGIPFDLVGLPFDDPLFLARLIRFIQEFVTRHGLGEKGGFLAIANQPDVYLQLHRHEVDSFIRMLSKVRQEIEGDFPSVKIGSSLQLRTLYERDDSLIKRLSSECHWVGIRQYAQGKRPLLRQGYRPGADYLSSLFVRMASLAEGRRIFATLMMPTSPLVGGSEELQAQFADEMLEQMPMLPTQFLAVNWGALYDRTLREARLIAGWTNSDFGGIAIVPAFQEFLRTSGLFDREERGKAAAAVFRQKRKRIQSDRLLPRRP